MRFASLLGGMSLLLGISASALAQTTTAIVRQPGADVRSGRGDAQYFYATNRLAPGERVEVIREEAEGWLAIKPPPGSVSWINKRFVRHMNGDVWTVESLEPVDVVYGSSLHKEKPNVRSVSLERGTIVVSTGQAREADDGLWLPIKPPPAEVRYVRASEVTRDAVLSTNPPASFRAEPVGSPSSGAANWNRNTVPPVPTPVADRMEPLPIVPADPRWAEAERLEKAGRIREAIELYDRLGREVANTDHALAMRCYNQAAALRRGSYAAVDTRLRPMAAGNVTGYAPQTGCTPCPPSEFTFRGRLREAYQSVDNKPTFALENSQGQIVAYVTSAGASLEPQLHRVVEVSGPACWSGYVRCNYVRATRVIPLQ